MGGVAVATLGLLAFLALRGGEPMALLYADLDLKEAGQITDQLDHAHITHQEDGSGTRIMVPANEVARARLLLAKAGLPSGGSLGYEIFDRGDSMTASQFQQNINETRALEGELERSIRMINGVRGVRVHLVLPRREPFAREKPEAQASVLLTMAGASRLDREGVQAVLNLVAAAVPGLKAAEHLDHRQPRRRARPRRQPDRSRSDGAEHRGDPPRRRAPPLPHRRGDARAHAGSRPRARRGLGRDELRPDPRDRRELQPRPAGRAQHADGLRQQQVDRAEPERLGAEQPAQRQCRHLRRGLELGAAGGDDELRDRQDRAHRRARPAADQAHQPRGAGRWQPGDRVPTASRNGRRSRPTSSPASPRSPRPRSATTRSAAIMSRW